MTAAIALPLGSSAHALPQSSVPAQGTSVPQPPTSVSIVFGETPDLRLSSITVLDRAGANVNAGPTTAVPGNPDDLEVPLKAHLPDGVYTVTWKTVSTTDGHLATGSFVFGVGVAVAGLPHTSSVVGANPPSPLAVLARLLLFVGLIVVVGAVVLSAYAFGAPPVSLRRVIAAGAVAAFAGTIGVVAAEAMGADVGLTGALASSLGRSLLARAVPAIILLVAALVLLARPGRHAASLGLLAGAAGIAGMAVDVLNSHAAAQNPMTLNELVQLLHITAVGVWIGGLVALLVSLRRQPTDAQTHFTRRLSTLAGFGLVVVVASGVFRAVIEVQTWGNLVSTAFGALVLLKIGLLLVLAGLGAFNRYGNLPRLPRSLARLRRVVTTEVLVALGALTVAAALVNVAPPTEYAAAAASSQTTRLVVSGSDYATTVKVRLVVNPGSAGFNTFDLRVADYTSGNEVRASNVMLQFSQPLRPTLGISSLVLNRQRDGTFLASGGNLSLAGIWEVAAIIENGEESVEVHLQLITIMPPPEIRVSHFGGGLPTVYTIQLPSDMQAQVYLDPDKPGVGEFHVTFLSPAGVEVPIAQATVGMTVPGGMPTILVTRRLDEIGHFVSDATVPARGARFDILATTVAGQSISTYIVITPGS